MLHRKNRATFSAAEIPSPRLQVQQAPMQFPKTSRNVCVTAMPATKSPARLPEIPRQGQNDWPCAARERTPSRDPSPVPRFLIVLSYNAQLLSDIFREPCRPAPCP